MGTLLITMGDNTLLKTTETGAPVVAYNGKTLLSASSWSGSKILRCAGQKMATNVTVGSHVLVCAGRTCSTTIGLSFTVANADYETITLDKLTDGKYTIPTGNYNRAQFFAVGGGGGPAKTMGNGPAFAGGAGGGYTALSAVQTVSSGQQFTVTIGSGGKNYASGGTTIVKSGSTTIVSAKGGSSSPVGDSDIGYSTSGSFSLYKGGAGGSGGGGAGGVSASIKAQAGDGGSDGGNGEASVSIKDGTTIYAAGGTGQGTSTIFNKTTHGGGGGGAAGYDVRGNSLSQTEMASLRGIGGVNGGGNGGYAYAEAKDDNGNYTVYHVRPTSGTDYTGGGAGGQAGWKEDTMTNVTGGCGVVIVKLWEE